MILMDRENALARGWSHVHSDAQTLDEQEAELQAFRRKVGAPPSAYQGNAPSWLHLDIMRAPRRKALADPSVRIFETSRDLVVYLMENVPRNVKRGAACM